MSTILPVFQARAQRMLYNFFPHPPIEFPVTDGEIEPFPRRYPSILTEALKGRFKQRRSLYKQFTRQIASNARRPGRGKHVLIIIPETMNKLLETIGSMHSPSSVEVERALWSIYYQGKIIDELDLTISEKTISRLLKRAERIVGIIPDDSPQELVIGLPTIKISYQVLRFGRDGIFDFQVYFSGRVF